MIWDTWLLFFFDTWDSQYPNVTCTLSKVGYGFYFQAVSKESYSSAEKFHILTFSFQDVSECLLLSWGAFS